AKVAKVVGEHSFGGKLAILLVKITASEIISEFLIALDILFNFEIRMDKLVVPGRRQYNHPPTI
ncbi:hypothetical protein LCGC14_0959510, partial [marine sediment metagenome]